MIANLIRNADTLVIGGGMVFTFLAAQGYEVGKSLLEEDQIETVRGYLNAAASGGKQILLPTDIVVAPEFGRRRRRPPLCRPTRSRQTSSAWTSARSRLECSAE